MCHTVYSTVGGVGKGQREQQDKIALGVPEEVRLLLALEKERAEADKWVSLSGSSLFQCVGTVEAVTARQEALGS